MVSVSADGSFILWDPKTAKAILKSSSEDGRFHQSPLTCLAIPLESQLMITGAEDGSLCVSHLQNGKVDVLVQSLKAKITHSYSPICLHIKNP